MVPAQLLAAASVDDHLAFKAVLALHILAAMLWVGGGITVGVLGLVDRSSGDLQVTLRDLRRAGRVRTYCFLPASLGVLGCGFGLVALGHFSLRDVWLDLALGGWFVALGLGTGYLVPLGDELTDQALREAPEGQLRVLVTRLRLAGALESLVLVLVVIDMVVRP